MNFIDHLDAGEDYLDRAERFLDNAYTDDEVEKVVPGLALVAQAHFLAAQAYVALRNLE